MSIKKVQLNRIPVVSCKAPEKQIPVPSSEFEKLNRSCQQQFEERKARQNLVKENAAKYHAGSNYIQ